MKTESAGLAVSVFFLLTQGALASTSASPASFSCVARLYCPNSVDASLQELPGDMDSLVSAATAKDAREDCLKSFSQAYQLIQKRAPAGCLVQSEAFLNARR